MVRDADGTPIILRIGKPAWRRGDACGYRLARVDADGMCHLKVRDRGRTYVVKAPISDVRAGPYGDVKGHGFEYGTAEDLERLLKEVNLV